MGTAPAQALNVRINRGQVAVRAGGYAPTPGLLLIRAQDVVRCAAYLNQDGTRRAASWHRLVMRRRQPFRGRLAQLLQHHRFGHARVSSQRA